MGRRLPSLGPRGEGWFIGQLVFLVAIGVAPVETWPGPLLSVGRWAGTLLVLAGLVVAGRGVIDLGPNLTPFPRPRSTGELVERGVYGVLRHPIYGGLVLMTVGWSLVRASIVGLLLSLTFALFLDLKARREEQLLSAAFPDYEGYRRRTSRFIPRIY